MKDPKILFLIRHFTPDSGYGGPINSLNGILKLGVNSGNNFVITSNRYFRSNMVMDVTSDRWISYSGSSIFYSSGYLKLLIEILKFRFDSSSAVAGKFAKFTPVPHRYLGHGDVDCPRVADSHD